MPGLAIGSPFYHIDKAVHTWNVDADVLPENITVESKPAELDNLDARRLDQPCESVRGWLRKLLKMQLRASFAPI